MAPLLTFNESHRGLAVAATWAGATTVLITAPWLSQPGYLFGTDFPGPRRFASSFSTTSNIPVEAALAFVSRLVTAQVTGKLLYMAIIFVATFAAYQALPVAGFVPRAAASTVYVFNPFVFGRFHYGQLFLLAGFAVLPWVAFELRELCRHASWQRGLGLAVSTSVVGAFTLHLFLVAWFLAVIVYSVHVFCPWHARSRTYTRLIPGAIAVVGTAALSAYWIVPFLLQRSFEARVIGATGPGELTAYAAVPDQQLGLVPNLLGLYGFWAENSGRFTSMKGFVPEWPLVLIVLIGVSALGAVLAIRGRELRMWVICLLVASAGGLVLEMGVSHPWTAGLVHWLDSTFTVYRGMRDAGKWAALFALVYSQLFGIGTAAILDWVRKLELPAVRLEWVTAGAIGLLLAVPLYYGNGLLFGMHGEIKPSEYPAGWYAADRVLAADPHPGRTLFLPWHEYMAYDFIQNQNRIVLSPAVTFFSAPILSSANPEFAGSAPTDPEQESIAQLVAAGATAAWAAELARHGVKYVLVVREVDWQTYDFLAHQPNLNLVHDYQSILLYRNSLVT
jgi:hypothetical protein